MQISSKEWDDFLKSYPNTHVLQSSQWGELKSSFGWACVRLVNGKSGAQILLRKLPAGFRIAYIPKGPLGNLDKLMEEIDQVCLERKAIFLKVEPDVWEPVDYKPADKREGWYPSNPIQPRRTILVSLEGSDEEILARMKQKTRYNVHLAQKRGVTVKPSTDIHAFYEMARTTSKRDGFGVHQLSYYQKVYDLFHTTGEGELLLAYYGEQVLAGLMVLTRGNQAFYMYGASTDAERNRMPAYLIQWEAMRWAKTRGSLTYDLWGIPDFDEEILENQFTRKDSHDGLWGVYRFKRGFGGVQVRSVGAWDRIYDKKLYTLYRWLLRISRRSL